MHVGFTVFGIDPTHYGPLAAHAEELGFDSIWLADHMTIPQHFNSKYPYAESGEPPFSPQTRLNDVWVTMGHIAAQTKRIKLGTGVYILPLRSPFVTAQAVVTAQNLSGGRVLFGVGSGWLEEEFDIAGERFAQRGARMDEILDILAKLWTGDYVEHRGKFYQFAPTRLSPAPISRIPLIFGGTAPVALRRAALRGDGWWGPALPIEEAVKYKRRIDELRAAVGRAHEPFPCYFPIAKPINADTLRRYEDAGIDHFRAPVAAGVSQRASIEDRKNNLERFVEQVTAAGFKLS